LQDTASITCSGVLIDGIKVQPLQLGSGEHPRAFQIRQDRPITLGELICERSEVGGGDPAHQDHRLNILNFARSLRHMIFFLAC
jgi:hypothetical protein